jgi:PadR family transcriptional regulator PadR
MLRSLFLGFVKLHILHHAEQKPVYGLWLIDELGQHGYKLSPGTLYPILHSLEEQGYLLSQKQVVQGKVRRYYHLTPQGVVALAEAREKVSELAGEIIDKTDQRHS